MKKQKKSAEERQADNLITHARERLSGGERPVVQGIVIDPPRCEDADDAFWVFPSTKGTSATIVVAIADVPFFIPKDSLCDRAAGRRGQTYYENMGMETEYMLPDALTQVLSLGNKKKKPCIAITLRVSTDGSIDLLGVQENCLNRKATWDYRQAEKVLKQPKHRLYAPLNYAKVWANILSQSRRSRSGVKNLSFLDAESRLAQGKWASHRIVAEFMIAANAAIAAKMQRRGVPMLYRNHHEDSSAAFYSPEPLRHHGLGLTAYCHATSPIRRFADLVNLRIVKKEFGLGHDSYSLPELAEIAESLNLSPEVYCA